MEERSQKMNYFFLLLEKPDVLVKKLESVLWHFKSMFSPMLLQKKLVVKHMELKMLLSPLDC